MNGKLISEYLRKIGAQGGKAGTGKSKVRGGTTRSEQKAYYERISRKAVKARKAKRKETK
jgi:hypothetical protein